jgi:signal transduction histidine kinase
MKRWKKPSMTLWLVAALLALLPLLAYWQYRWLGQVSVAERERMQRNLKASAAQFCQDFDQELTFAYESLQDPQPLPFASTAQNAAGTFAERYQRWLETAAHPRMVRAIYQTEADEQGEYRFALFNPAQGRFEPHELTPELKLLQESFSRQQRIQQMLQSVLHPMHGLLKAEAETLSEGGLGQAKVVQLRVLDKLDGHLPALFIPLGMFQGLPLETLATPRYRVVLLDSDYLKQELFPALAKKYLFNTGAHEYNLAVLRPEEGRPEVFYQSEAALAASAFANGDVVEGLFKLRFESRDRMFFKGLPPATNGEKRKQISIVTMSNEVKYSETSGAPPLDGQIAHLLDRKTDGAWQLVVKHRAGSLEAAVATIRRRNLVISFGVLLLLGVSIGLIVVSSRRAQALAEKQIEFVAGVSHELRTPLSVICSAAENLADGVVDNRDQIKRYGTLIRDEGRRLTDMVEQMLEFAGAQSGRQNYELRPLEPERVIDDALAALHVPLSESGFAVERQIAAELPLINADGAALSRALQNLLSNAMKYSGENLWLTVRAETAKHLSSTEVRIAVQDRGLGIRPEDLPHIFEPFYRGAEVTAAQIHGNGLGLSLVKHVIEAHGGRISVESQPGQGSTFTLHLPIVYEAASLAAVKSNYEQAPAAR